MKRLLIAVALVSFLGTVACDNSETRRSAQSSQPETASVRRYSPRSELRALAATGPTPAAEEPSPTSLRRATARPERQAAADRSLARSVDLEIEVADTEAAADRVREIATSMGGYLGASDAFRSQDRASYAILVRVPAAELEAAVERIKELATVVHRERIQAEDVTSEVIDVDARLRTLRATEAELQGLLTAAGEHGLQDVMAVYRELNDIRTEIERYEARQENLQTRIAFAAIGVAIRPDAATRPVVTNRWSVLATARDSGRSLVIVLRTLADLAIFFVIVIVPVTVLVALPIWGTARLWRRARGARISQPSSPAGD